ncbi:MULTISPECIES: hypothetical protein [unclassified Rhizobium]|uniref:hypothetical protein n=1 Tax=unclassified Rhizobium TaxID=2613769 RepID=UPI000ABAF20B|nr:MULTISPECIES: hypothetical protein [unclassified Rhizobium]
MSSRTDLAPFVGSKLAMLSAFPAISVTGRALGTEPLFALIMFSSGTRTAVNDEGEGAA